MLRRFTLLSIVPIALLLLAADDPVTHVNCDNLGRSVQIIGKLGKPIGTFVHIESHAPHHPGMLSNPLEVQKINGRQLDKPIVISTQDGGDLLPDHAYSLDGYENGAMNTPEEPLVKAGLAKHGDVQQPYGFDTWFCVLKGGPSSDAKPAK